MVSLMQCLFRGTVALLMRGYQRLPLVKGFGKTQRIDNWWNQPAIMATVTGMAIFYTGLRVIVLDGSIHYENHRVTPPIFSPDVLHLFHITIIQDG